jgi:hypothetical protein
VSNAPAQATRAVACLVVMLSNAGAASLGPSPEDRYVATRDAAIARFSSIHDAGRFDDAAKKDEETARADLQAQMSAILGELNRNGADGWYVEPKAHIIITTQAILARWLRAHKDWWDKGLKNVQQIAAAFRNESFYTQAMSTDAAVVNFDLLQQGRRRSCWRRRWDGSQRARELAGRHDGHSAAGVTAAISGFLSPPNVVSWILPSTIWMRRSARAASAASWVTTTTV